ncbi:uncharacterized protein DNG_08958 [Cephalotrichum gorgonifer]|uniref:Uncharacterized protein n=1 Tax=Cephalotrichum gorgonifer TaxID=2041049 RepID=A0AAE8SYU9_9PEZI|nr:uncharacterized protein DNG_08958 [Cephalotrichum gorgonifer]
MPSTSINPQSQSAFVTRLVTLPTEVRDAIYLELWRSSGNLRQHIVWHGDGADRHFCRWPCTTTYRVKDELQAELEKLRCELGIPLGRDMQKTQDMDNPLASRLINSNRRLQSPWINHWACGERVNQKHGLGVYHCFTTSGPICFKKNLVDKDKPRIPFQSAYLPMLLSCKLLSEQCLKSIYESITFVFTDLRSVQMFFGYCKLPPPMDSWHKVGITPPGFFKFARTLELSITPEFPALVVCANHDLPGLEGRHSIYDFHWLRLDLFQNLSTLNIWIPARSTTWSIEDSDLGYDYTGITEFDADGLAHILAPFKNVANVTISTPLGPGIGPEEGFMEGAAVRVYKRGSGDRFHPPLYMVNPGGTFDRYIHTSETREVRLACNGGGYVVMEEVR